MSISISEDFINFDRIAKAQLFYKALGYSNIEVPWLVSKQAIYATAPQNGNNFELTNNDGILVGSGEQGFIQLMMDDSLPPGKYQTITPCFRSEENYDDLTRKYFMKVELIDYAKANEDYLSVGIKEELVEKVRQGYQAMVNQAIQCLFHLADIEEFEAKPTKEGYDIIYNGIELGSYGVRQMNQHLWTYGTGLAEPRFSLAIKSTKNNKKEIAANVG